MTIFTVKTTKGCGSNFSIKLGADILDGLSDEVIKAKAEQSMVIELQGKLRKCEGEEGVIAKLNELNWIDATVGPYVKVASETAKLKAILASGHSVDDIMEALEAVS